MYLLPNKKKSRKTNQIDLFSFCFYSFFAIIVITISIFFCYYYCYHSTILIIFCILISFGYQRYQRLCFLLYNIFFSKFIPVYYVKKEKKKILLYYAKFLPKLHFNNWEKQIKYNILYETPSIIDTAYHFTELSSCLL